MSGPEQPRTRRPLLLNGEALRLTVQAPSGGGGDKFDPVSLDDAQQLLTGQLRTVLASSQALTPALRDPEQVYIEARLLPNYLAASYFPGELLGRVGAVAVGSRSDRAMYRTATRSDPDSPTRRLVIAVSDQGLEELTSFVASSDRGRGRQDQQVFDQIRRIDEVALPALDTVVRIGSDTNEDGSQTLEAVLHPATYRIGRAVALGGPGLQRWYDLVESLGGRVHRDYQRSVGGLTFSPVTLDAEQARVLGRFNPLRALRPMPTIRPRPRFGARSVGRLQPPADPTPQASTMTVAVFDGGVDHADEALFPVVRATLTGEPPQADDLEHGTGVTGAVLYGLTNTTGSAPSPPLPVHSYRVLPVAGDPTDLYAYWLLDRIVETVRTHGHRLVNLSIGPEVAVEEDQEPNRWTSELDMLAWDQDVLFVTAAGNSGEADRATGLHRVQSPADMANGLGIGACDCPSPDAPWTRASYSSTGPGRSGNWNQPSAVTFGGTDDRPFPLLAGDGTMHDSACGTSFAAPLATHALAGLGAALPRTTASVLRGFSVHFAERHPHHKKMLSEVGHGRLPLSFAAHLECTPDEVHVLFVDTVERDQTLGYQLPLPTELPGDIGLRLTLAFASPVEPTQPTEYTQAALGLVLRPHQRNFRFYPPAGSTARATEHDLVSVDARTLLAAGWRQGQEPVTFPLTPAGAGANENQLRESGKWETVRHHRATLRRDKTFEPRLEVSYVARRAGGLDMSPSEVPFALLVTAVDTSRSGVLYDRATARFAALQPLQRASTRLQVPPNTVL